MRELLDAFADEVRIGNIEIYNEFSLQHELGIYLRGALDNCKVMFERNVSFFDFPKSNFIKRELDISVVDSADSKLNSAIELKFPRNGQYPEQMYSFCKDVKFAEQLRCAGFPSAFVMIFADDHLFYEGNGEGIYGFFRGAKPLAGCVTKPTGKRDSQIDIQGRYPIQWHNVRDSMKYTVIEAQ